MAREDADGAAQHDDPADVHTTARSESSASTSSDDTVDTVSIEDVEDTRGTPRTSDDSSSAKNCATETATTT